MNEKQAWGNFARTGKIEDYIKYTQVRNRAAVQAAALPPEFSMEGAGADKDSGAYHSRADGGRERQTGVGIDPR